MYDFTIHAGVAAGTSNFPEDEILAAYLIFILFHIIYAASERKADAEALAWSGS